MAPNNTHSVPNKTSLRSLLEGEKLNHTNFLDWYRSVRIVLKQEKKEYVLNEPLPEEPPAIPKPAHDAWLKKMDDSIDASCLMLATMIPDLQKDLENHSAYDMIHQLKEMFQQLAGTERFETVRAFHTCKMEDGQSVSSYVLKMKSHIDHLARLGVVMPDVLATDMILNSLTKSFDPFVMNYNMNGLNKTIPELHGMLITGEKNLLKKTTQVLMIKEGGTKRTRPEHPNNSKGKGKAKVVKGKGKKFVQSSRPPKKKAKVAKEDACFECGKVGHWKINCPTYLAELKKKNAGEGTSGVQKE
ncbi:hypothetical protein L2E82_28589 [Cichorium intybus]|uniref:Uncharacterized protein n=1 Tax=Cichorium intybus TaxID=13427 RepID=A0ACB9CWK2_CICIN|nr:hypothetical protein L2E82_28589 [Cichorium intybus]